MKPWSLIPFWRAMYHELRNCGSHGFQGFQRQGAIFPPRVGLVILPVRCCSKRSWSQVQQKQQMLFTIIPRDLRSEACQIKKTRCGIPGITMYHTLYIYIYIARPVSNDFWFTDGRGSPWRPRHGPHASCTLDVTSRCCSDSVNFIWIQALNTQTMIRSCAFREVNPQNRVSDTYWVDIQALGARIDHNRQARVPKGWAEAHGWDCPNTQDSCFRKQPGSQSRDVQDWCKMNLLTRQLLHSFVSKHLELSSRLPVSGKVYLKYINLQIHFQNEKFM